MIIVLMGYMGSGKSTIGRHLSEILSYQFQDLDTFIETTVGLSVPDIFKTKGELFFRKKEAECLKILLESEDNLVLALGGGTPCYGTNMKMISDASNVTCFYLKASIPTLVNRLMPEKEIRPLLNQIETKEELAEFIGKHLFERNVFYSQSDVTITTDDKSIKSICESIVVELI
ncbi:shikimate kinase [Winogradskyella maritima]|uniref:Shikimate kinase n=1 Tax=Winogradskyella maritima TaxID=1517766 RepID=A0ABV8ALK7_9FLAO|nr:shikimate kinase [Winogradskyella maritima]